MRIYVRPISHIFRKSSPGRQPNVVWLQAVSRVLTPRRSAVCATTLTVPIAPTSKRFAVLCVGTVHMQIIMPPLILHNDGMIRSNDQHACTTCPISDNRAICAQHTVHTWRGPPALSEQYPVVE